MPETSQVHVDAALTNVSVAYSNPAFLGDLVAPRVLVRKQSDKYYVYDGARERFRASDDRRAPGAEAAEVNFALSQDSYFCADHALESTIPDEERENADPAIAPDIDRTEFLTDKINLNKEMALAALFTGASSPFDNETVGSGDTWDDEASDPLAAIGARRDTIHGAIQREPNTLVLSHTVYHALRAHPKILAMASSAQVGAPGPQQLAAILDIERVLVARAWQNTAAPGQTATMTPVWGSNAVLLYAPSRPGLKTVAAVYTFLWGAAAGSVDGSVVEVWREPRRKSDMIRVQKYYDLKVVAAEAAFVWLGAVA